MIKVRLYPDNTFHVVTDQGATRELQCDDNALLIESWKEMTRALMEIAQPGDSDKPHKPCCIAARCLGLAHFHAILADGSRLVVHREWIDKHNLLRSDRIGPLDKYLATGNVPLSLDDYRRVHLMMPFGHGGDHEYHSGNVHTYWPRT